MRVGTSPGTMCTPSSTIDQPSWSARSIEARTPTSTFRDCWRKPNSSGSSDVRERVAGREARVVDRRHEAAREERAHRLADEVGRGDARDPETVRDLGGDGRLAGAGRAADQDHERQVELAQLLVAAQPHDRVGALLLAEDLDGERRAAGRGRRCSPPLAARSSPTRLARAYARVGRDADGHQRARHQAARVREAVLAAERQRHDPPLPGHARTSAFTSPRTSSSSPSATTSFAASTTSAPRASAASATTSIAAAFSSTR